MLLFLLLGFITTLEVTKLFFFPLLCAQQGSVKLGAHLSRSNFLIHWMWNMPVESWRTYDLLSVDYGHRRNKLPSLNFGVVLWWRDTDLWQGQNLPWSMCAVEASDQENWPTQFWNSGFPLGCPSQCNSWGGRKMGLFSNDKSTT